MCKCRSLVRDHDCAACRCIDLSTGYGNQTKLEEAIKKSKKLNAEELALRLKLQEEAAGFESQIKEIEKEQDFLKKQKKEADTEIRGIDDFRTTLAKNSKSFC